MMVVNMRHEGSWDVRVDRATRWGNPYQIGLAGTREVVIRKYREWLWEEIKSGRIALEDLAALHGKRLGCWCAPEPCHADVLVRAARWATLGLELKEK